MQTEKLDVRILPDEFAGKIDRHNRAIVEDRKNMLAVRDWRWRGIRILSSLGSGNLLVNVRVPHQGTIDAESEKGKRTTFIVKLPCWDNEFDEK